MAEVELQQCKLLEESRCSSHSGTLASNYADRYSDASAAWVMLCAMLMFFMKAGFLYVELAFSDGVKYRRQVVLAKYVDTFSSTIGFWLFGYAISGNTSGFAVGEEQDYVFWFFRFTFASNTATIIGGTLVGQKIQLRMLSVFFYAFFMSSFIHPPLARWMWSAGRHEDFMLSPFRFCNGTRTVEKDHRISSYSANEDLGKFVFLDFAGSGLVHLCGGMASFALQWLHKLEKNTKGCCINPCKCSRHVEDERQTNKVTQPIGMQEAANQGEAPMQQLADTPKISTKFAFNAGSTESIEGKISHAAVGRIALVMALAAASGGLTSTIVSHLVQIVMRHENFNTNEIANGVLACLVAVTGCCPFIDPPWAVLIGVLTILFYHCGCAITYAFGLHDGAKVFPVHGVCGFWGVLCVGIFSKNCLIEEIYETACYCQELILPELLETQGILFLFQLTGGLFIAVWSGVLCFVLFFLLWIIPIKCINSRLCYLNPRNGIIEFKGNMLFTHFEEIGSPDKAGDMTVLGADIPLQPQAP